MRKALLVLLCMVLTLTAFVACGHTHTYEEEWSSDAEGHWYAATCEHTEEKGSYAAHVDENEDEVCDVCEYTAHVHTFAATLTSDATGHWYAATCGHNTEKKDFEAHVDTARDGECDECGYEGLHTHTWNTTAWNFDDDGHWNPAICGPDCPDTVADLKGNTAAHVDEDEDGECDVCDYDEMHRHTFSETEWESDDDNHWRPSTCEHDRKADEAAHVDEDEDGECDVCTKTGLHVHTYDTANWQKDASGHWHAATCTDEDSCATAKNLFAAHADTATVDGLCDICGYEMYAIITVVNPSNLENTIPTDAQDIGSEVTFTVVAPDNGTIRLTGATQVGDGVVDGTNTTYTYKIASVDVGAEVTITFLPFGTVDYTNTVRVRPQAGVTPGATATIDIWANASSVTVSQPTDPTGYTKYTMEWNENNSFVGPSQDGTSFIMYKKITIVSIKNEAGEESVITINNGTTDITYKAGDTLASNDFGGSFSGVENGVQFYPAVSAPKTDTLVMAFQTKLKYDNNGQGQYGFQLMIDVKGIALSEYLQHGNNRNQDGGLIAYNKALLSPALFWDGGSNLSFSLNSSGDHGYVSLKDGAYFRVELHEHATDSSKMTLKFFLGDLTAPVYTKEVAAIAINGIKDSNIDEQSGRIEFRQISFARYAEFTFTETTFVIYE